MTEEGKEISAEVAQQATQQATQLVQVATSDDDTDAGDPKTESVNNGGESVVLASKSSLQASKPSEPVLPQDPAPTATSQSADDSLASLSESTATLQRMFEQERERLRTVQAVAAAAVASDLPSAASMTLPSSDLADSDSTSIVIPPIPSVLAAYNPMGLPALATAPVAANASKVEVGIGLGAISWDEARRPFGLQQPAPALSGPAALGGAVAQPFPGMGSSLGLGLGGLGAGSAGSNVGATAVASNRMASDGEAGWGLPRSSGVGVQREDVGLNLQPGSVNVVDIMSRVQAL